MINKFIIIFILITNIYSANGQKMHYNKDAVQLNNQALALIGKYFQSGDSIKEAILILNMAISIDPSFSIAYINKAHAQCSLNLYQQAITTLNELLSLYPDNGSALVSEGMMLEKLGRYAESKEKYQRAFIVIQKKFLEHPDSMSLATGYLTIVFLKNGKEEAIKEYSKIKTRLKTSSSLLDSSIDELKKRSREELIDASCGSTMR